jgi:hypothetical protein
MPDQDITAETTEHASVLAPPIYPPDIVEQAVMHGIAAAAPTEIGDHGVAHLVPPGYTLTVLDERASEDRPRWVDGTFTFVNIESWQSYTARHRTVATLDYARDLTSAGLQALTSDSVFVTTVLDDHGPVESASSTDLYTRAAAIGRRKHIAQLVLRPTPEARRWAKALSAGRCTQEQMLDLIDDGIGQIAEPDGATLRDLVADLHAIRTTEVQSVVRTGGDAQITTADLVQLRAGKGNTLTIPEHMKLVFPLWFTSITTNVITVKIKPRIESGKVSFELTAPDLDRVVGLAVADIAARVPTDLLWTT